MKPFLFSKSLFLILLISAGIFISNKTYGQYLENDRIDLKNKQVFIGKIIEDNKADYLIIQTDDYGEFKINYSDISRTFRRVNLEEPFYKKIGHQYLSISVGAGHSYGGYGVRFQQRVGRKVGFAYSIGLGLNRVEQSDYVYNTSGYNYFKYQSNTSTLSIGLKFYPYKWAYAEAGLYFNFVDQSSDAFIMLGYDYAINRLLTINAGIGTVSTKDFIIPSEGVAFDLGLMFRFPTPKVLIPYHPDVKKKRSSNYNQYNYTKIIDTSGNSFEADEKHDRIYLKNGDVLKGKITKIRYPDYIEIITSKNQLIAIKYKVIDKVEGSPYRVSVRQKNRKTNKGLLINQKPEEGITLLKSNGDTIHIDKEKVWNITHNKNNLTNEEISNYKRTKNYFSISAGYGVNYGSPIGIQLQYKRSFNKIGLGLHMGGTTSTNWGSLRTSYMFGFKFYLFDIFYSDFSYGIVENSLTHVVSYYDYDYDKYTGFALMFGVEYFFNQVFGINAAIGGYYAYEKYHDGGEGGTIYTLNDQFIKPSFDLGMMIKFNKRKRIVLNTF